MIMASSKFELRSYWYSLQVMHTQKLTSPIDFVLAKSAIIMDDHKPTNERNYSDWVNLGKNWVYGNMYTPRPLFKKPVLFYLNVVHSWQPTKYRQDEGITIIDNPEKDDPPFQPCFQKWPGGTL